MSKRRSNQARHSSRTSRQPVQHPRSLVSPRSPNLESIWRHFQQDGLRRVCTMDETAFAAVYGMETVEIEHRMRGENFYAFKDNGSKILAVAHLDTVVRAKDRMCDFANTADGMVVYSGALDDRLGAYIILDLLPLLGINVDVLLTVGEESCRSTAQFFKPPKEYNWVIEFDRGGRDVVMYQYEDEDTYDLVEESGAKVGQGSFSDIAVLNHLKVKAFNWGVGYRDYHGKRSHAFLNDTFEMLDYFMKFYSLNQEFQLPHNERSNYKYYRGGSSYSWLDYGTNKSKEKATGAIDLTAGMGAGKSATSNFKSYDNLEAYLAETRVYAADGSWTARGSEGADAISEDEEDGPLDPSNETVTRYLARAAAIIQGEGEDGHVRESDYDDPPEDGADELEGTDELAAEYEFNERDEYVESTTTALALPVVDPFVRFLPAATA